jgi:hypothetical protein
MCKKCGSDKTKHLTVKAIINGEIEYLCPLGYAIRHKEIHGTEWKPKGAIARSMLSEALEIEKGGE